MIITAFRIVQVHPDRRGKLNAFILPAIELAYEIMPRIKPWPNESSAYIQKLSLPWKAFEIRKILKPQLHAVCLKNRIKRIERATKSIYYF